MLRGQSFPSKGKSPKRAPDLDAGSTKRRKQSETDKNGTAVAQQDSSYEGVSATHNPGRTQINVEQDSPTTSQERMDTSIGISGTPAQVFIGPQEFAENVLVIDVDFGKKASKEEAGLMKVLKAETAMRNTCGGVIILNNKNKLVQQGDQWVLKLEEMRDKKLSQVKNPDTFDEILDFKEEGFSFIFVRKSSIVLTEDSKCLLQRGQVRNQRVTSYSEICNILKKKNTTCFCASGQRSMEFTLGYKMPFPESKTAEFKYLTGRDLPTSLRKELRDYIAAFANTAGGTIFFGIKDDASILGQDVNDEEKICRFIEECMRSKLWIQDSGERIDPVKGSHYDYEFIPVDGAEDTFVIKIHICKFAGTVFINEPISLVLNEDNEIVNMDFKKWLALHKPNLTGDSSDYQERFEKKRCGNSIFYSVKETVAKIVKALTSAPPGQLILHPSHATKWIKHPALDEFIKNTKKIFKKNNWRSGIAYIEKAWEVNLGLPSTKPHDVICDILICCPQMPLVLVSLTQSDTPDETIHSYNRKVATRLKTALVQEAGCMEKFYIKPIVTSLHKLEVEGESEIYSESPLYPRTYNMSIDKYPNILKALVLILARANVMSSHIVGQGLFNLLTYEQYKILHEFYEKSPKVKITGPPGSGKTVLALERICRLRSLGCYREEVLFLCSNKPLKARVESMKTRNGEPLCIVKTYYEVTSGVGFNGLAYVKHILADEVQNFQEGTPGASLVWWSKLLRLCDGIEDSSFWVFFDIAQKINNRMPVNLNGFSEKELNTVIRQTGNVHRFITSKYMRVSRQVKLGHDFDGSKVDILVPSRSNAVSQEHLLYILTYQLHKLIVKDGHHANDITVLFSDTKHKEPYEQWFMQQTNNSCPVRNGEEVANHGVVFDTIRRYSGVDDNIIIGFCPEFYCSGFQDNDALMTTLCSRTKLKLILIFESEYEADYFHLAPSELKEVEFGNMVEVSNFSRQ